MGLLSKILGSDEKAKSVLDSIQKVADSVIAESADALKSVQNAAQSALDQSNGQQAANQANPVNAGSQVIQTPEPSAQPFDRGSAESGLSWGEFMPSEPNQHNFPGSYTEYFESIFREEMPQFTVTSETVRNGTGTVGGSGKDAGRHIRRHHSRRKHKRAYHHARLQTDCSL